MKNSSLPPDALDQYLRGELSEVEVKAFEAELDHDPALRAELDYHQELMAGFAVERKSQLKSILQNTALPVTVGIGVSLWQTQWFQWTIAAVGAGAVATTVWVATTFGSGDANQKQGGSTDKVATEQAATTSETLAPAPAQQQVEESASPETETATPTAPSVAPTTEVPKAQADAKQATTTKAAAGTKSTSQPSKAQLDELAKATPSTPSAPVPMPDAPEPMVGTGDKANAPTNNLNAGAASSPSVAETVVKADPNYNMHYQYFGGKLYLYGKFDKGLYEVLDLNAKGGKSSFVYYQGTYYPVAAGTTSITALEACKDKTLIATLDKLRKGQR